MQSYSYSPMNMLKQGKKWKNNKDNNKNNQCIGALCIGSFASHARDLGFVLSVSICDYRRSDIGLLDTYILYIFIYIHIYIYCWIRSPVSRPVTVSDSPYFLPFTF